MFANFKLSVYLSELMLVCFEVDFYGLNYLQVNISDFGVVNRHLRVDTGAF